jgi:chemotaxis protein CheC
MNGSRSSGLEELLRRGAADASTALAAWLGRPASIAIRRFEELPLAAAADALGTPADPSGAVEPICAAAMSVSGGVSGLLLLASDDRAGLALADLLLERPVGTSGAWDEVERSAILETANIVGCSYLNRIATAGEATAGVVPSPPLFIRDYASAVMQGLVMERSADRDHVFLARTEFVVDGTPVRCGLLFVPDADGLGGLSAAADPDRGTP